MGVLYFILVGHLLLDDLVGVLFLHLGDRVEDCLDVLEVVLAFNLVVLIHLGLLVLLVHLGLRVLLVLQLEVLVLVVPYLEVLSLEVFQQEEVPCSEQHFSFFPVPLL